MKRSEINRIMREGGEFLRRRYFLLPPFAWWSPEEWATRGPESRAIVSCQLGWDITDFGSGDFPRTGLFLFTIRNGTFRELKKKQGKVTLVGFGTFKAIENVVGSGAELLLYSVNAITTGTDAQGEVTTRLSKGGRIVNGNGADTDIVIASARSYLNALNKLYSTPDKVRAQGGV